MPTPAAKLPIFILALSLAAWSVHAQQGDGTRVAMQTHIFKPAKVDATPERIASLKVPPGFSISVFARGLKNARILAVAPDGTIYVSRRDQGDVLMLADRDGDGRADGEPIVVARRSGAHGLVVHDGKLFIETVKEIFVAPIQPDGRLGPLKMIVGDLPDSGQHANRTLAFGPDDMLYLSVGSTCNDCNESNPENASLLRAKPDGSSRNIFASGLRNMIGFDWSPVTGEIWGLDNGIDFLGDEDQPEELNHIERGKQYGWPHVYGDGKIYPQSTPVGNISKEEWKRLSTPMVMGYAAHAAPMQLKFYTGAMFPAEYRNDAFATMRGSWNRDPAAGYEIVRIHFDVKGQPQSIMPFVTGFLTDGGTTHFARPMGLAVARDGALLMADDANGVIYRVAYAGPAAPGSAPMATPADAMRKQGNEGFGVPLALQRPEARGQGGSTAAMRVESPDFSAGGPLPALHSAYADNVSPALRWQPVKDAASYALIVEDPDSKPSPTVHWVVYGLPAGSMGVPQGVQVQPRLTEPDGVLQGKNTHGVAGYYGPHPPIGDPPHHYHFQVLALDTALLLKPGASRDEVLAAARGHVIGAGELIGTYQQVQKPMK